MTGLSKKKSKFPIKSFLKEPDTASGTVREVANSLHEFFTLADQKLALELPPSAGPPCSGRR